MGLYVAVKFTRNSNVYLSSYIDHIKIDNPIYDFHTTVVYSKKDPITEYKILGKLNPKIRIISEFMPDLFDVENGKKALVLKFSSEFLNKRHLYGEKCGCSYDYPEYKPHISLSYNSNEDELSRCLKTLFEGEIILSEEFKGKYEF